MTVRTRPDREAVRYGHGAQHYSESQDLGITLGITTLSRTLSDDSQSIKQERGNSLSRGVEADVIRDVIDHGLSHTNTYKQVAAKHIS